MDHDIALHSIMITNLDKRIDLETMNEHLELVFTKIFQGTRVISSKVVGQFDSLFQISLKLKKNKKYFRYYKKHNLKSLSKGDKSRKMLLKKRKGCCQGIAKFDAEEYFKQKIMKRCLIIKEKED